MLLLRLTDSVTWVTEIFYSSFNSVHYYVLIRRHQKLPRLQTLIYLYHQNVKNNRMFFINSEIRQSETSDSSFCSRISLSRISSAALWAIHKHWRHEITDVTSGGFCPVSNTSATLRGEDRSKDSFWLSQSLFTCSKLIILSCVNCLSSPWKHNLYANRGLLIYYPHLEIHRTACQTAASYTTAYITPFQLDPLKINLDMIFTTTHTHAW